MSRLRSFDSDRPDPPRAGARRRQWPRALRLLMILVLAVIVGGATSYALRTLNL